MGRRTKVRQQAGVMDQPEGFHPDLIAHVKSDRDQQDQIQGKRTDPHPNRAVRGCEGNKDLRHGEGQIIIHQQDKNMQPQKPQRKQGNEFVEVKICSMCKRRRG